MTDECISPLRRRMIEESDYIRRVKNFAVFLGRTPDRASRELSPSMTSMISVPVIVLCFTNARATRSMSRHRLSTSRSAPTRTQMESNLRASASVKKGSAIGFLKHLVVLLKQYREKIGRGRHLAIAVGYVQAVEAIWRRHGLGSQVGLAFDYLKGDKGENVESRFQRFGRLALAAVGDQSGVSRWQVKKVKLRAKMFDKQSKPLKT